MRRIIAFTIVALAVFQAWSVMGQDVQDPLSLSSPVDAPAALTDFLNDTVNATVNDTVNATVDTPLVDLNLSLTSSQAAFLDVPVNETLIDTNLSLTSSQAAFLDVPVNETLIDTVAPGTLTQREFLTGQPVETTEPFYMKGRMMGSGSPSSTAEQPPSAYTKGQMMA
ncbi:MAG: hypothetical protein WBK88_02640 [Methanothrix sp.]